MSPTNGYRWSPCPIPIRLFRPYHTSIYVKGGRRRIDVDPIQEYSALIAYYLGFFIFARHLVHPGLSSGDKRARK
ncbi:MAG: hypothetical protein Ct9H300mP7_4270 [Verrucomicrobiota bacterium]|nr:MAG: hypothetical protein Ct9H300mP7_4270 [Verrucomicrobiota bacterium]